MKLFERKTRKSEPKVVTVEDAIKMLQELDKDYLKKNEELLKKVK